MGKRNFYKNTTKNVMQIFNLLKKSDELLTVSKISKLTGLHKWTVSRTLDLYMAPYVEITTPEGFEDVGLNIKFVRLKNYDITKKQVLRLLKFSNLIKRGE